MIPCISKEASTHSKQVQGLTIAESRAKNWPENMYSKTCLKRPLKIDKRKVIATNCSLMKVKSLAECSIGALCNAFDLQ